MSLQSHAYPVDLIRICEQVLLDAQSTPDELMRQAAPAVAAAAGVIVSAPAPTIQHLQATDRRILLLVGAGGHGGDALYERPADRNLGGTGDAVKPREAAILLDHDARLVDGVLRTGDEIRS